MSNEKTLIGICVVIIVICCVGAATSVTDSLNRYDEISDKSKLFESKTITKAQLDNMDIADVRKLKTLHYKPRSAKLIFKRIEDEHIRELHFKPGDIYKLTKSLDNPFGPRISYVTIVDTMKNWIKYKTSSQVPIKIDTSLGVT